jgi:hypothetical protein
MFRAVATTATKLRSILQSCWDDGKLEQLFNIYELKIKAVVFDVGGVLIDLHAEGARRELNDQTRLG